MEWFGVVTGDSRSLEIAPFDTVHTSSYYPYNMSVSCTVSVIYSETLLENRRFYYTHPHLVPPLGVTLVKFHKDLSRQKTVPWLSCGLVCMINLAVLLEHRFVMDRLIDGGTNGHRAIAYSVYAILCTSIASSGKK